MGSDMVGDGYDGGFLGRREYVHGDVVYHETSLRVYFMRYSAGVNSMSRSITCCACDLYFGVCTSTPLDCLSLVNGPESSLYTLRAHFRRLLWGYLGDDVWATL